MWGALLSSDSDLNEAAAFFRDTSLVFVYGTRDQYAEEGMIPNYEKLLESHSIPFSVVSFNGGHRMDRDTLKSLATTL